MMYKLVTFLSLFPFSSLYCHAQDTETLLKERCLESFELIKEQDLNAFIAQMPIELNEVERLRAAKILARAYERWYLDRDVKNIRIIGVTFSDIKEKHQFNAEQEARVNVRTSSGQNRKTSFCKFIKNAAGWFLTKLP